MCCRGRLGREGMGGTGRKEREVGDAVGELLEDGVLGGGEPAKGKGEVVVDPAPPPSSEHARVVPSTPYSRATHPGSARPGTSVHPSPSTTHSLRSPLCHHKSTYEKHTTSSPPSLPQTPSHRALSASCDHQLPDRRHTGTGTSPSWVRDHHPHSPLVNKYPPDEPTADIQIPPFSEVCLNH